MDSSIVADTSAQGEHGKLSAHNITRSNRPEQKSRHLNGHGLQVAGEDSGTKTIGGKTAGKTTIGAKTTGREIIGISHKGNGTREDPHPHSRMQNDIGKLITGVSMGNKMS